MGVEAYEVAAKMVFVDHMTGPLDKLAKRLKDFDKTVAASADRLSVLVAGSANSMVVAMDKAIAKAVELQAAIGGNVVAGEVTGGGKAGRKATTEKVSQSVKNRDMWLAGAAGRRLTNEHNQQYMQAGLDGRRVMASRYQDTWSAAAEGRLWASRQRASQNQDLWGAKEEGRQFVARQRAEQYQDMWLAQEEGRRWQEKERAHAAALAEDARRARRLQPGSGGAGRPRTPHARLHMSPGGIGMAGGMALGGGGGAALMGAAVAGFAGYKMAEAGGAWQAEQLRLRQYGMGDALNASAVNFVLQHGTPGISHIASLRAFNDVQGMFRDSGKSGEEAIYAAKVLSPQITKMQYAYGLLGKELSPSEELSTIRFMEMSGGLKDPAKASHLADLAFKLANTSGNTVTPEQLRQFKARSLQAGFSLTDEALVSLEPIMSTLKGSAAGTMLRSASNRITGVTKGSGRAVAAGLEFGLFDPNTIGRNKKGEVSGFRGTANPLLHADEWAADPSAAYYKYLMPLYEKAHMTEAQRDRENAMIFGNAGALFDLFDKYKDKILASKTAFEQQWGIDKVVASGNEGFNANMEKFKSAWTDFITSAGIKLLPGFTAAVWAATQALNWYSGGKENLLGSDYQAPHQYPMKGMHDGGNAYSPQLDLKTGLPVFPGMPGYHYHGTVPPVATPPAAATPTKAVVPVHLGGKHIGTVIADILTGSDSLASIGGHDFNIGQGVFAHP